MAEYELYKPNALSTLRHFGHMLREHRPFCFVRFSDGEIEILRNRYLEIADRRTRLEGQAWSNHFPRYNIKEFNPKVYGKLRSDLLESATRRLKNYYKGVPTFHNRAVEDRDFLVRLNGGMSEFVTFADLLINSNYARFRDEIVPLFPDYDELLVIANYRARPVRQLGRARHISIGDNFFANYEDVRREVLAAVLSAAPGALVLSSASSLSNILGYQAYANRPDLTFIDIGTSLNDLLSLDARTRTYHEAYLTRGWTALRIKMSRQHQIKW